jgi:hypothetical protein
VGREHWARSGQVWDALAPANKGCADLPANRESTSCAALARSKIESTVRYLAIEVDDAIEIAEKIDI